MHGVLNCGWFNHPFPPITNGKDVTGTNIFSILNMEKGGCVARPHTG